MKTIAELQTRIHQTILEKKYPVYPSKLYDPISYMMNLGGKRLRPTLLLMACDAFHGDLEQAINPAMAIEIFHNFTLMHDDIMDNAPLRRGMATVHRQWDQNVAILSGDVMLVEAYKLVIETNPENLPAILGVFNATAAGVCEGQQIDMDFEEQSAVSLTEYLNMIRLKTAVLLGGALKIGALIAKANAHDAQHLYGFGEKLGIAFQLQDDILDVYANPEKFGKRVGGDIISNKKTYLLITALQLAQGEELKTLQKWLHAKSFDSTEKVAAIKQIYTNLKVREQAETAMNEFATVALEHLQAINLPQDRKKYLLQFAEQLLVREN